MTFQHVVTMISARDLDRGCRFDAAICDKPPIMSHLCLAELCLQGGQLRLLLAQLLLGAGQGGLCGAGGALQWDKGDAAGVNKQPGGHNCCICAGRLASAHCCQNRFLLLPMSTADISQASHVRSHPAAVAPRTVSLGVFPIDSHVGEHPCTAILHTCAWLSCAWAAASSDPFFVNCCCRDVAEVCR